MSTAATAEVGKARGRRVTTIGVVASDRRDKTIKVVVNYLTKHPKYGKYLRRRTTLHAHDPNNEAHAGDTVELMACRPISKTKTWRLVRVIRPGARTELPAVSGDSESDRPTERGSSDQGL